MKLGRRHLLSAVVALSAGASSGWSQDRGITDSVGRRIRIPSAPRRIVAAGPPASILLYALAPDAMAGWVPALGDAARPYLLPAVRELAATGRLTGRTAPDLAALKALGPDLILDFGSIAQRYVKLADDIQASTGIPYALIDGSLGKSPESLRLASEIVGRHERGEALARYAADTLQSAAEAARMVPAGQRPRVYLAAGDGLRQPPRGSGFGEILAGADIVDVAAGLGQDVPIPMDQVRSWDPSLIVAFDRTCYDQLGSNAKWRFAKRIVVAPQLPWNWLGEPPSINRLMGLRWLVGLLYPRAAGVALDVQAREFHHLFYGAKPSAAALAALLEHAQ